MISLLMFLREKKPAFSCMFMLLPNAPPMGGKEWKFWQGSLSHCGAEIRRKMFIPSCTEFCPRKLMNGG